MPDVSLNAVANLGYADCRFLKPVFPGDHAHRPFLEVIGLKENSNKAERRRPCAAHARKGPISTAETVIDYVRWVMVRKRDAEAPLRLETYASQLPWRPASPSGSLGAACPRIDRAAFDGELSGTPYRFEDYWAGQRVDHVDGVTVEEGLSTRRRLGSIRTPPGVHFNQFSEGQGPARAAGFIYGGHVILARPGAEF